MACKGYISVGHEERKVDLPINRLVSFFILDLLEFCKDKDGLVEQEHKVNKNTSGVLWAPDCKRKFLCPKYDVSIDTCFQPKRFQDHFEHFS